MVVEASSKKAYCPGALTMLRRRTLGLTFRVRTNGRKIFILVVLVSFSIFIWLAQFDRLTIQRDLIPTVARNVPLHENLSARPTSAPHVSSKYNTSASDHRTVLKQDTNFTAVILLTYMRSGSSFTGELLQQAPDSFYVFEPLRMLNHLAKSGRSIQWLNGTVSSSSTVNITLVKKQTLIGWLTCNFSMIYAQAFDDLYFLSFGKKTTIYKDCITKYYGVKLYYSKNNTARKYTNIQIPAFRRGLADKCLLALQNVCLASKFRIVKTIRTQMSLAKDILDEIRYSKVIHLIRDPRPTVLSQAHYQGCPENGNKPSLQYCAKLHCGNVWSDTEIKKSILRPDKMFTVLYEHLASNPSKMTEILYHFVGMKYTDKIRSYANIIANRGNITGCKVCEQPWQSRNPFIFSSDQDNFLRTSGFSVELYIQRICSKVVKYYGYEFYNTSQT